MMAVVQIIFDKALAERHFASVYGKLCAKIFSSPKIQEIDRENPRTKFSFVLLTQCQVPHPSAHCEIIWL